MAANIKRPSPTLSMLLISGFVVSLVAILFLLASCTNGFRFNYRVDTVMFKVSAPIPHSVGPAPNIHIDTNLRMSGLLGGAVTTRKPYSIAVDFTDPTFTASEMVLTKVTVTYEDGGSDPEAATVQLPLRIKARTHETTNSVAGGQIVKNRVRSISGRIPGAVTRDVPFTLRLEGKLVNDDGSEVSFAIEHKFDVVTDTQNRTWGQVMREF